MYDFFHTRFFNILKPKTYNLKPSGGFTLIELLVVVAIIGILSTVVFATIGGTRGRARDAKRLAEVKEMQLILAVLDTSSTSGNVILAGCGAANALTTACSGNAIELASFADPSTPGTACTSASAATCGYSISKADGSAGATSGNYRICFYLEDPASAGLTGSLHNLKSTTGGSINSGC